MLPALMLVLALLLEPACMGFSLMVMRSAAAETARVVLTSQSSEEDVRAFALRRLAVIPEVSLFHVGGADDWTIETSQADGVVNVRIAGHARPLPLMGVVASAFGQADGEGVVLSVEVSERLRASWVRGGYGDWQGIW